jgi:hypothetical protein
MIMAGSTRDQPAGKLVSVILITASLTGLVAGGVISITADPNSGWWLLGSCLVGVSGAIFGAVFGLMASQWSGDDVVESMRKVLDTHIATFSAQPEKALLSAPELLQPWRRPLHHYHLTTLDGAPTWRYRVFRFDTAPNEQGYTLDLLFEVGDPRNQTRNKYEISLVVRDSRLLLVQRRLSGHEPTVIEVFPHGSDGFRRCAAGVAFFQNWDGAHMTSRCLISRTPLITTTSQGSVADDADIATLNSTWESTYSGVNYTH